MMNRVGNIWSGEPPVRRAEAQTTSTSSFLTSFRLDDPDDDPDDDTEDDDEFADDEDGDDEEEEDDEEVPETWQVEGTRSSLVLTLVLILA